MLPKKIIAISVSLLCSFAVAQQYRPASFGSPVLEPVHYETSDLTASSSSSSLVPELPSANGLIRTVPVPPAVNELPSNRPFRSLAVGFTANTLGAGIEVATRLSRSFNLRSGFNLFSFSYPFNVDGLNYNAQLHFNSSTSTVDWFPGHRSFHISPGILYSRNSLAALASVGPGQSFELGDQAFVNSVNDPVSGTAAVIFPHKIAPMLMMGFGNILPQSGRHFSVPFEIGAAYTGAPTINVNLNGTACTTDGCVSFATNPDAQSSLRQEVSSINETLKRIPVYPIVSLGVAYHF